MSTSNELEPLAEGLKALLDVERGGVVAPAAAKARVMAKALAALGPMGSGGGGEGSGGAQGGAGGGTGGATVAAGKAGTSAVAAKVAGATWTAAAVTKLGLAVGAASLAVGGVLGAGVHAVVAEPQRVVVQAPAPVVVAPKVEVPVAVEAPPPTPPPSVEVKAPVVRVAPVAKVAPALSADEALGVERSLIDQARTALGRSNAAGALEALQRHAAQFPHGQLVEERDALEVVALSAAGRGDEAKAKAEAFRRVHPSSLLQPAVDAALH